MNRLFFMSPIISGDTAACSAVTVTGYRVDHSAYDAYMYLIETPDKRILHTGDFRGHGYCGKAFIPTVEAYVRQFEKREIDILITEGTMMNRDTEKVITEHALQRKATDFFLKRQQTKGVEVKHLHTSGHADKEMLARAMEAVNPKEAIYPMHTENAAGFYELAISDTLKNKIQIPQ